MSIFGFLILIAYLICRQSKNEPHPNWNEFSLAAEKKEEKKKKESRLKRATVWSGSVRMGLKILSFS